MRYFSFEQKQRGFPKNSNMYLMNQECLFLCLEPVETISRKQTYHYHDICLFVACCKNTGYADSTMKYTRFIFIYLS